MKKIIGVLALAAALTACPAPTPVPTLSSIALTCTANSIVIAGTTTCTAVGKDSSGTNLSIQPVITFTSSDPLKATVSSTGLVTGVAPGTSTIRAESGAVQATTLMTVITPVEAVSALSSITLTCIADSIPAGGTTTCTAVGKDSKGTTLKVQPVFTFSSSDPMKVTVSSEGLVTGVQVGSSTIKAEFGAVQATIVITVLPSIKPPITKR
jgi:trimeric autotransporter adhesin